MRGLVLVIVQLIISLLVVGAVMPAVLFSVTATRIPQLGMAVTGTIVLSVFLVLRMAWPRSRRN